MPLIDVPFKRVAIDLIGPINPTTNERHGYILTIVDYATWYPEAVPLKGCTAKEVAEALMTVFSRVGIPNELLTDQGRQSIVNYIKELMNLLEIKHKMTSLYHPMGNGLVESFNGVLKQMQRRLYTEQPREWNRLIDKKVKVKSSMARSLPVENLLPQNVGSIINYS